MSIRRKRVIPLAPDPNLKIILSGSVIPYDEMMQVIKDGKWAFVDGISRATAHGAARRLTKKLRRDIKQSVAYVERKKGYIFYEV